MGWLIGVLALAMFVGAVVGLTNPRWAGLEKQRQAVPALVLSFLLLLVALLLPDAGDAAEQEVGSELRTGYEFDASDMPEGTVWPLTINGGRWVCESGSLGPALFVWGDDGKFYPLNGHARDLADVRRAVEPSWSEASIDPIWLHLGGLPRPPLEPLIAAGSQFCRSVNQWWGRTQ